MNKPELRQRARLGYMKFLPSDAAVLACVESPPRPVVPERTQDYGRRYTTVFLRSTFDGSKKP